VKLRFGLVLLVPALLVLFLGLIPIFDRTATLSPKLLTGAGLTVAVLLAREWTRDRYVTAVFLLVMLSLPCFAMLATAVLFSGPARLTALIVCAVLLVPVLFLARVVWQERHLVDLLPNWLLTRFARKDIFEDDGVAWTLEHSGTDVAEGCHISIYLQNNIEAERTVHLRLWDESGFWQRPGKIRFPELRPITLLPRAHAIITVSVAPATDEVLKKIRIYAALDAHGAAAARNRGWRARPGPRPISKLLVVLGPIAGEIIRERGGVFLAVESSGTSHTATLPSARVQFV